MICDECQTREATCQVTVLVGGEKLTRHLCEECLERMRGNLKRGLLESRITDLFSSILSTLTMGVATEMAKQNEPAEEKTCEACGLTLTAFRKSGRLGCPACYKAFREELEPMLKQIHGRTQHAGRRPLESEEEQKARSLREELSRQMEEAVRTEDFETAARIRDQLREMAGEASVCGI